MGRQAAPDDAGTSQDLEQTFWSISSQAFAITTALIVVILTMLWLLRHVRWWRKMLVNACASFMADVLSHDKMKEAVAEVFTGAIIKGVHELLVDEETPAHLRAAIDTTMPAEPLYEVGQQFPSKALAFARGLFRGLLPLHCLSSMERCVRRTTGHGTRCCVKFEACVDGCLSQQHRQQVPARILARLKAAADRAKTNFGTTRDLMSNAFGRDSSEDRRSFLDRARSVRSMRRGAVDTHGQSLGLR